MPENYRLDEYIAKAKIVREERKQKYGNTYREMSTDSLVDFAKAKLERYKYSRNEDDIVDILNYIEFIIRQTE